MKIQPASEAAPAFLCVEFDRQTVLTVEAWAQRNGSSFAEVMRELAAELARDPGAVDHDPASLARALRFEILDLRSPRVDKRSEDKRSDQIRSDQNRKVCAASFPQVAAENLAPAVDRSNRWLDYYAKLTGNTVTAADITACLKIEHLSDLAIEAGILQALVFSRQKVGSFSYCARAIHSFRDHTAEELRPICEELKNALLVRRGRGQLVLPLEGEKLLIGEFTTTEETTTT